MKEKYSSLKLFGQLLVMAASAEGLGAPSNVERSISYDANSVDYHGQSKQQQYHSNLGLSSKPPQHNTSTTVNHLAPTNSNLG